MALQSVMVDLTTCLLYYNYELFLYFLDQGANSNATNKYGNTPFQFVSFIGHKNIVEYLVSHG